MNTLLCKRLAAFALIPIFLTACAGRQANPVQVDQVGDARKSCATIEAEMKGIQAEIARLVPETDKTGKNVGLGIAGAFLIIPLFFMDLTESEKIEVNAYRQRYNRLTILASEKKCAFSEVSVEDPSKNPPAQTSDDSQAKDPLIRTAAQRIEQLNDLYQKGLINKTEFETKRKEILDSM
jgi:hypothetical protein